MTVVKKKHKNESFDAMFKRFRKTVERNKIEFEVKRREFYEKPSIKKKRDKELARKTELKRQQDQSIKRSRI
tara:strand:- start:169 stop:384 length:216 start_codon:yes stop_codon:yes gene_type:complete